MTASPIIPCVCAAGRPCGKVLTVSDLGNGMTVLTIETEEKNKKIILNDAGRRALVEALGGRA